MPKERMMMRGNLLVAAVLVALGAGACDGGGREPETSAGPEGEGVLLDSARQPLERAREVEDLTRQRKDHLDHSIEHGE